jgi:DNA helicase-2/ATP-dependent DNA helicase PcrA
LPSRASAALRAFCAIIDGLAGSIDGELVSMVIAKTLDRSGYLASLREERTEEAEGRIENLMELVSAAREFETRESEPSLAGFVDRLSLLSEADEASGSAAARVWLMTMHAAKGLEFPTVVVAGLEEGLFPHSRAKDDLEELEEERRLCYVGMTRAETELILTSAARRRVFGEYQTTEPSRFLEEIPPHLLDIEESHAQPSRLSESTWRRGTDGESRSWERRPATTPKASEPGPRYEYEQEGLAPMLRPGARVRHAQFGVGTVVGVEVTASDTKVTVKFNTVGLKRLLASFAKLEPA